MSEESFVMHSAPTLAGIKTGNLFTLKIHKDESVAEEIRKFNLILTPKGIRVIPLRKSDNKLLIYVYRPGNLKKDFHNKQLVEMLNELEYPTANLDRCIVQLKKRVGECENFPHEIGLFLGYPPEDVQGFIQNEARNFKISGTWKVYGDEHEARKRFARYDNCTREYCSRIEQGCTIEKLAVQI